MYEYSVYPVMSKSPKQLLFLNKAENYHGSNHFQWCPLTCLHLYCYRFLLFALHESGTRKALSGP